MSSLIDLRQITKHFKERIALDNINLKIEEGEIFTLLGPNGSGKTTLLKIMALLTEPTSGEIYFEGVKVNDRNKSQIRDEATMVFQKTILFNTTVYKNVAYGLNLRGLPKREINERVGDTLKQVKLEGYERRVARKLSGGEQQRVSLARALALNTKLLLLDEPTANLDPRNMSIIEETISRVNREFGTTVITATHNMFQAETITKRVALLIEGRLTKIGAPNEIFKETLDLASFARLENVFSGVAAVLKDGNSRIDVGNGVCIEASIEKSGKVTVFVRPEDIILSKDLIVSSARNMFKGRIAAISDFGSIVRLQIDAGKQFVVQVTKRSFNEMQLNVGSEVYMAFKASSVHLV